MKVNIKSIAFELHLNNLYFFFMKIDYSKVYFLYSTFYLVTLTIYYGLEYVMLKLNQLGLSIKSFLK